MTIAPAKSKTKSQRARDLALIHIAANQLGLIQKNDDENYRAMLWCVARVKSARDLDAGGREAVINHLRNCGFKDVAKTGGTRYVRGTRAALIRWLWSQLANLGEVQDRSDRALRRYIAQHGGLGNASSVTEIAPQHLEGANADTVIEQLKAWVRRVQIATKVRRVAERAEGQS